MCVCVCVCVCVCECLVLHCLLRDCSLSDGYVKAISARRKRVVVRFVGQADLNSLLEMATGFMSYTQLCCIARLGCNGPPGFCYLYPSRCLPLHPSGGGGIFQYLPCEPTNTAPVLTWLGAPAAGRWGRPNGQYRCCRRTPPCPLRGCWLRCPWRGVLSGPLAWGATRSLAWGATGSFGVGWYQVPWRGMLPGPLAWGATGSFGVGCYQVLWRGVLPGPLAWGATGSFGVGWNRVPWRGVVPAHFGWGGTGSLCEGCYPLTWPCSLEGWCWRSAFSPNVVVGGQSPLLTVLAVWHGWVRVASDPVRVSETERSQYSVTLHAWSQFDCRRLQRSF